MKNKIIYKNAAIEHNARLHALGSPLMVTMILTHQCQMRCCFCSQGDAEFHNMKLSLAKKVLEDLADIGVGQIGFTGGEPLLYPYLEETALLGADLGFAMSLITNGLLLHKFIGNSIFDHVKVVGVSIHGTNEVHDRITGIPGSCEIVKKNLLYFHKKYPSHKLFLNFTYSNQNNEPEELESVLTFAQGLDASVNVARINEKGRSLNKDYYSDINEMLRNIDCYRRNGVAIKIGNCIPHCIVNDQYKYLVHGCSAGVSFCAIDSDGKVKLCPTADFALGDLNTTSFAEIWNSPIMGKFRSLDWLPLKCGVCKEILKCCGACKIDGDVHEWPSFQDSLAKKYLDQEWKKLASKKLFLKANAVRSEGDLYILMCEPLRFCSEETVEILSKMNGTMTGNELISFFSKSDIDQECIKELIHALYADKMIYTD